MTMTTPNPEWVEAERKLYQKFHEEFSNGIPTSFETWLGARQQPVEVTQAMVEKGARGLSAKQYEHDVAFYGLENIGPPPSDDSIIMDEQIDYARACLTAALSVSAKGSADE